MQKIKEENTFRGLCSDTTFKYLWKNYKTRKILEDIILKVTGINLDDYKIIDNELNSGTNLKDYRLDIVLKKDNNIISIEMNSEVSKNVLTKNHTYLYRLAGNVNEEGDSYETYFVTQINFNNCTPPKVLREPKSGIKEFTFRDIEGELKIEGIKNYEIYLLFYKDICYNYNNLKESYLSMFSAKSLEKLKKIAGTNKEMTILVDEVEKLNKDKYFGALYDKEKVQKKLLNSEFRDGKEEGIREGIKEGVNNTAIAMLKEDIPLDIISKCTNIKVNELIKLKEEIIN